MEPQSTNGMYAVAVTLSDDELICGYPTNFAKKDGRNYYHSYHLVALMLLASYTPYNDPLLSSKLAEIALDWFERTNLFTYAGYEFSDPQSILRFKFIDDLQLYSEVDDFDDLVAKTRTNKSGRN